MCERALNAYDDTFTESLKCTGMFMMLWNVSLRSTPLNGVVANW